MKNTFILRIRQVIEQVGLSRASIYRLIALGKFPPPVKIGISAVGWVTADIEHWLVGCKQANGGHGQHAANESCLKEAA